MRGQTQKFTITGRRIAVAALLAGKSIADIPGLLGISAQSLWLRRIGRRQWKKGELERIAAHFGVGFDYLIGDGDDI